MRTTTILIIGLAATAVSGQQAWNRLGPDGATVAAMTTVPGYPDDVYLITRGYPAFVYYTSNSGATWTVRDTIDDRIDAMALDPANVGNLYACGERGRAYRSTDNGRNWHLRGALPDNPPVHQLRVIPRQDAIDLIAAADVEVGDSTGLALFRSTDDGSTWSGVTAGSGPAARALLLAFDPVRPNRVFTGGTTGDGACLFGSADGGVNWDDLSAGLEGRCAYGLAVSPTDSAVLICATDAGVYRSTSSGNTWTRRLAAPAYSVAFAQPMPHYAYAGSDNLVYRSNDNGINWSADTTEIFGTDTRWLELNPSQSLELYASNGAGIFYSTNGGYRWTEITGDLNCHVVPFLYYHPLSPETVYTCPPGCGILSSADLGLTWTRTFGKLPNAGLTTGLAINPRDPDTTVVVTSFSPELHLTIDHGDSWETYLIADRFEPGGVAYSPADPETLYAWGRCSPADGQPRFTVLKSATAGRNWTTILQQGNIGICLGFQSPGSGETLYAWGETDGRPALYRSTDRGDDWTSRTNGITGAPVTDFAPSPANRTVYYCATPNGVFRSLTSTGVWSDIGLANVTAVLPDTANENAVWAGTDTAAIYYTTDAGANWERDTLGLASRSILLLQRHPDNPAGVYCSAEGAGLWERGVIGIAEQRPARQIGRIAVRPSIITGQARIKLTPGTGRKTTIDLYHANGRHACRIARYGPRELMPANHTWTRPTTLPAGAYLLVVRSNGRLETTKLLLAPQH